MKNKLHLSFLLLEIVCWFLFIGLAIETGGYLSNTIVTLFVKPEWASHFWGFMDLSNLFQFDLGLFICLTSLLITVSLLKTILFYKTILIFHKKKFNLDHPFNPAIQDFLFHFCYIVFAIGLYLCRFKIFQLATRARSVNSNFRKVKPGRCRCLDIYGSYLAVSCQNFQKRDRNTK